jgi:hypothetical protein
MFVVLLLLIQELLPYFSTPKKAKHLPKYTPGAFFWSRAMLGGVYFLRSPPPYRRVSQFYNYFIKRNKLQNFQIFGSGRGTA